MNKQNLIQKLKQLDGLTADEKSALINLVNTKKKYGLVWEDKIEDVEEELREKLPVLKEVKEKAIINDDVTLNGAEVPNHILIEGDNLHALTALTFTHEGKIDVIYIDPPYNRGERDFKYNDDYIDKENPFKHSLWLSFINKRLKVAKRLLAEDGIIIIHIDEHEFDALNLLLETEIFDEKDCLGQIVWNKQNPKGDAGDIATMHEYILVYAKNKQLFAQLEGVVKRAKPNAVTILKKAKRLFAKIGKTEIPEEIKEVVKPFNFSKEILKDFHVTYDLQLVNKEFQSWLNKQDFSGGEKAYKFIDEIGKVYQSVSMAWPNKEKAPDDYYLPLFHPTTKKQCPVPARGWRNPSTRMKTLEDAKLILFGSDETTQPRRKYLLEENMFENTPSIYNNGSSDDELLKNLGVEFPYPKPVSASKYFLKNIHPNPRLILDFFGGSGTTLHAVMALNKEDGGTRQCILVSNDESNICEEVTYKRNEGIINGYANNKGVEIAGLKNNSLRYYKCDSVASEISELNKRKLTEASTSLLQIKENCYIDLTIENGFEKKYAGIFTNPKGKYLIVIYHSRNQNEIISKMVALIKNLEIEEKIKLYVFSPEMETINADFIEVFEKIEAVPLPEAIYNAYKHVFRLLKLNSVPVMKIEDTKTNLFNA